MGDVRSSVTVERVPARWLGIGGHSSIMRRECGGSPTTHYDTIVIVALLFIIAVNVSEMNLRSEKFPRPWFGAVVVVRHHGAYLLVNF